ncbi:MAG: peptidase, partial [Roseiflexaceae bacterium]
MDQGYYRFPTIHNDTVVFVCEGDLWSVPAAGGIARRLTSNPGEVSTPAFSPDGALLAFAGRDEGAPEVYIMPAEGGPARRLTFLGANSAVVGWSRDGQQIIFSSNAAQPIPRVHQLYTIDWRGGEPQPLPTGPAMSASFGPDGAIVIARNTTDLARWKRYRGGLAGQIWIDLEGDGDWRPLQTAGNVALPQWVGERIYFIADYQGVGNLYSCRPTGEDLRRHTHHSEYYVRHISTDGARIVYHAGADLFVFDPATNASTQVAVEFYSPRTQRNRKFVDADAYVQSFNLHPHGHSVALTVRGRPFTIGNWDGPALQHGEQAGVRYRLTIWLGDGKRLATICDSGGTETLEVHATDASLPPERLEGLDIGRPISLHAAPQRNLIALTNHRFELMLIDLDACSAKLLDRSKHERIHGAAWSPDGRWLAYAVHTTRSTSIIRLCEVETGRLVDVTTPVLRDVGPAFDPGGKYLYFLSYRDFNPVYDSLQFDLNFPQGGRPYLVTLRADLPSPFTPARPSADAPEPKPDDQNATEQDAAPESPKPDSKAPPMQLDLDGITNRVVAFPVPAGRYSQIR